MDILMIALRVLAAVVETDGGMMQFVVCWAQLLFGICCDL
jgi:hypothetical protein